jgi:hypothetical protein
MRLYRKDARGCSVKLIFSNAIDLIPFGMRPASSARAIVLLLLILVSAVALFAAHSKTPVWIVTWSASQQIPEPQNALAAEDLRDATVRQIFHLSAGGPALRVHVSNAFGAEALHFTSVHIAHSVSPASAAIDPATDKPLTFAGSPDVNVPPGAEFVSDPIEYQVPALSDVAVTFHLDVAPVTETAHPGSRSTSYFVHGNFVASADLPEAKRVDHWYQIAAIDVLAGPKGASVVVLGDSITDGHGAPTNGNDRWTDVLALRLQKDRKTRDVGVSNQGIGGNHLLTDGLGPNALARFDRDVLAQAGVRWLIVFEGVNDLGGLARTGEVSAAEHVTRVREVVAAYEQIITPGDFQESAPLRRLLQFRSPPPCRSRQSLQKVGGSLLSTRCFTGSCDCRAE